MSLLAPVAFTSSKPAQQMAGWTEVTGGAPYFQLSRHCLCCSVVDPELFFSDPIPDPVPTFQRVPDPIPDPDPDPTPDPDPV
jgi:hypothetical protein